MGTAPSQILSAPAAALAAFAIVAAVAGPAKADPCTGTSSSGKPFPACFDPGNRLTVVGGTDGFGGSIELRNIIHFDDEPDLVWKMEHVVLDTSHSNTTSAFTGRVYRGVYIRHSRDGHVVLPFGDPPKKVFLPFDVGALVEVGSVDWRSDMTVGVGVMKTAALIDIARSRDQRTRIAFGPVASWDIELMRAPSIAVAEHVVSPFSSGLLDVHVESSNGLEFLDLRLQSGLAWHNTGGWVMATQASASVERTILAVNDRPVAVFADVRYDSVTAETTAGIGLRVALVQRADPRVSKIVAEK